MKRTFLGIVCLAACAAYLQFPAQTRAQQLSVAFGMNTIAAPAASSANSDHAPVSLTGGAYPSFSGDFLIRKNFGVQGELAWKGSQGEWGGFQPYRPLFWDFNGMYQPRLSKDVYVQLLAGIGSQSTRFYTPNQVCNFTTCTNYVSVNRFMGHFGGGIKLYAYRNFFVRPEAHFYLVNNNQEFSGARALRYGVSIGYTFGR